jgi:hypothetical protein
MMMMTGAKQDVSLLLATAYQFVMRWMNLHVMYLKAGQ